MTQQQLPQQQQSKSKVFYGECKWYNVKKGYGFISMNDGSDDVFVHQTALYCKGFRSLQQGEKLEFEVQVQNDGRRKAINVTGPNGNYCLGSQQSYYNSNNNYSSGYSNNNYSSNSNYNSNRRYNNNYNKNDNYNNYNSYN